MIETQLSSEEQKLFNGFTDFLTFHGIQYFSAEEFFRLFKRTKEVVKPGITQKILVQNSIPPRELWWNIIPTLKVLEMVRRDIGKPIILDSAYRSPAYNTAVGGEEKSYHMLFKALDFRSEYISPRELYEEIRLSRGLRITVKNKKGQEMEWKITGGLGLYKTFVHYDCRDYNTVWKG